MDDRLPHIQTKAHKAIAKTALGSEDNVKWKYFKDFASAKDYLKSKDVSIYAVEQSEFSKPINELKSKNKSIALVVGPEVDGLPDSIIDQCDGIYEIPMVGKKESFNVSVASGIALYQASL
jgi:tRNA G18 (ribose-2'-O)-methylase SpoU